MKMLAVLLTLLYLTQRAYGQDVAPVVSPSPVEAYAIDEAPFEDPNVVTVVPQTHPLTKRVILVLDVSGSMAVEGKIQKVFEIMKHVMGQPLDDLEVSIYAFGSGYAQWPGFKDETNPLPYGWARMPNPDAIESAEKWLKDCAEKFSGSTSPTGALVEAIEQDRDDVSIVFATDGDFNHGESPIVAVEKAQKRRAGQGKSEVPILSYGIGSAARKYPDIERLGRKYGGGFYVDSPREPSRIRKPWR